MALAIEACERLPAELPHRLVLTGKEGWGDDRPGARTVLTGYVSFPMLSALYSAADLYLAPSRHEGFGLPVLEAFLCGCPVMCSAGGALPEVAGDAAEVNRSMDPNEWARAIADSLGNSSKLAAMRERGFRRVAKYSWRRAAEVHAQVYSEVAR